MISQVEHVARAFYDAETDGQSWADAPDRVKEEFRQYACQAIVLLEQYDLAETGGSMPVQVSAAA
jgi:hypothetical protein